MNAHARFVRFEIVACQKSHVVRRNDGTIRRCRELQHTVEMMRFVGMADARDFEIPAIAEMPQPFVCARERGVVFVGQQQLPDVAAASGQRNQTVCTAGEPQWIDDREIAAMPFDVRARNQTRQIQIADVILAK